MVDKLERMLRRELRKFAEAILKAARAERRTMSSSRGLFTVQELLDLAARAGSKKKRSKNGS